MGLQGGVKQRGPADGQSQKGGWGGDLLERKGEGGGGGMEPITSNSEIVAVLNRRGVIPPPPQLSDTSDRLFPIPVMAATKFGTAKRSTMGVRTNPWGAMPLPLGLPSAVERPRTVPCWASLHYRGQNRFGLQWRLCV